MKKKFALGAALSAGFLFLAARDVRWSEFTTAFSSARPLFLLPAAASTLLAQLARSYRWGVMLKPIRPLPLRSLFSATMIGLTANNLLPARLGEIARAFALGEKEQMAKPAAFATIVVERMVDVFFLLGLLWFTLRKISAPLWLERSGLSLFALNSVLLFLLLSLQRGGRTIGRITARLEALLPSKLARWVRRMGGGFVEGLEVVGRGRSFIPIFLFSLPLWVGVAGSILFSFSALNLPLPYQASIAVIVFVSLGSMIPSAPAYIGTTQYACVLALGLFAVARSEALAFSLIYHLTQFVPITFLGLFFLWRDHMPLGRMRKEALVEKEDGGGTRIRTGE